MSSYQLDARHMLCPLPIIKTQDRAAQLSKGDVLEVVCTDPGALNDLPAWCKINGHEVLETRESDEEVMIILKLG